MNINALPNINTYSNFLSVKQDKKVSNAIIQNSKPFDTKVSSLNYQANFLPVSFTGNAPKIEKASLITKLPEDIPLMKTEQNGSYIIDFDSQTELIYGRDAIKFLNSSCYFPYDTQVIIPKKCKAVLKKDGQKQNIEENSAILINSETNARVKIRKGYPMVIVSKKDFDWYDRYGKNSEQQTVKDKFKELLYNNAHLYNGDFSPNMFYPEELTDDEFLSSIGVNKYESKNSLVYDLVANRGKMSPEMREKLDETNRLLAKLEKRGFIQEQEDGYIKFSKYYATDYQIQYMKDNGFTDEEISKVMPLYELTKKAFTDARFCRTNSAKDYSNEVLAKMKETGLVHNNKKRLDTVFWKRTYSNPIELRKELIKKGFSVDEQNQIIENWEKATTTAFDTTGLKYIDDDVAVYNLDEKLNNWTMEKTNWVTNSTALSSKKGTTPFIGASLVQTDKEQVFSMSELRKGEHLHRHPNLNERRQTEIYMVTSGAAALLVVKDGKPTVRILNEGELAVIDPGVEHCVNSVSGEYEHIVVQVPSAFQYGFSFKQNTEPPEGFDEQKLTQEAREKLLATK